MQIFIIRPSGEVHEIIEKKSIKELLDTNECYILNDDISRSVYLWKGMNSSVRSKFNGARSMQDVRSQVGLSYRSVSMDEDEIDLYPEFIEAIKNSPEKGNAREIRDQGPEIVYKVDVPVSTPRAAPPLPKDKFNSHLDQGGPIYKGDTKPTKSSIEPQSSKSSFTQIELEKIIELLDKAGTPDGFEREMCIVGNQTYTVVEKKRSFLGTENVEHVLEPISTLPEGIFFADGYIPRVLIENQTVVAIEFLKKKL